MKNKLYVAARGVNLKNKIANRTQPWSANANANSRNDQSVNSVPLACNITIGMLH